MAELESLRIKLQSFFDRKGFDEAKTALGETSEKAQYLGETFSRASGGIEGMGAAIATLLGGAALGSYLSEATKDAYEAEKAMRMVTTAANAFGGNSAEAREEVEEFSQQLSAYAGVLDDEVVKAVGKAYLSTGSLEEGMTRAKLAADISRGSTLSFSEAMDLVEKTANGATRGLKNQLGIVVQGETAYEKAQDGLKKLHQRFSDTKPIEDNALAMDRANAKWSNFRQEVGMQLLPVLVKFREWVAVAFDAVILLIQKVGNELIAAGGAIGAFFKMLWDLPSKGKAAWTEFQTTLDNLERDRRETNKLLEEDAVKRMEKREADKTEILKKHGKQRAQANKDLVETQKEQEKQLTDVEYDMVKNRIRNAETYYAKAKALSDANLIEFRAYLKKLEKEHQLTYANFLKAEKMYAENAKKIERDLAKANKQLLDEYVKDVDTRMREEIKKEKKTAEVTEQLRREGLALAKRIKQQELEMQITVANAAVGLMREVFGDTKEVAIAQAIINTYEAATKAMTAGPIIGPILAALTIAMGLAQVAKIISTEPAGGGGGFDDPRNDWAAYQGGRKWAKDMIGMFSAGATNGVSAGWAAGMGGTTNNSTIDNSRHVNVTLQGAGLLDPTNVEMVKQLSRTLRNVERNIESQRQLGRVR